MLFFKKADLGGGIKPPNFLQSKLLFVKKNDFEYNKKKQTVTYCQVTYFSSAEIFLSIAFLIMSTNQSCL